MSRVAVAAFTVVWAIVSDGVGVERPYNFVVKSAQSGLQGDLSLAIGTTGTLIGNYNETDNPTGTRTKPGLFGSFGATENVAVPTELSLGVGGGLNSQTGGTFRMTLDAEAGTATIQDYTLDFVHSGPLSLPITVGLGFDTFRTRSPTFLYLGGTLNLPIGSADVTSFTATQTGAASIGALTPVGPNEYSFTVGFVADLAATVDVLGNAFELPATPLPLVLAGTVTLDGLGGAVLESIQPLELMNTQNPAQTLPQFAFDLPTLDADNPANVLFDLTLDEVGFDLDASLSLVANGVFVPEPASGLALLVAALWVRRNRS